MQATAEATPAPTSRKTRRTSTQTAPRKAADRVKTTIVLDRQTDIRLTVLAALKGIDRSALVAELLAPHLRGVVVSLRGQATDGDLATEVSSAA